jgi:hypothetical protein
MSSNDIIKNQSVPTLAVVVDELTFLIDNIMSQSDSVHYEKETVRCLRSLIHELKKQMLGQYCSQKYINEQLQKLLFFTQQYSKRDDLEENDNT